MRELFHRLASLPRRRRLDDELDEELRSHLEMAIDFQPGEGNEPRGRRRRDRELGGIGGVDRTKEAYRRQRGLPVVETALEDLHFGFRLLRRSPALFSRRSSA